MLRGNGGGGFNANYVGAYASFRHKMKSICNIKTLKLSNKCPTIKLAPL